MKYLKRFKNWIIFTVLGVGVAMAAGQVLPETPSIAKEKMAMAYEQSNIKAKYKMQNASFIMEAVDENAIQIEVGDKTKDKFSVEANILKWDNEVSMKVKPKINSKSKKKEFVIDGEKIKYKEDKKEFHFYEIENAYEVEVILLSKPKTNIVEMEIETQGLNFYYQPELTQEEIDDGAFRSENVIGSYAVYHSTKSNHILGQKNYMSGKAFHIYRPKIIDNAGTEVWGKLNITDNLLTVEIPQEFLDNAVYPVRHAAGLRFGYETTGSSNTYIVNIVAFLSATILEDGDVSAISYALKNTGGIDSNAKSAIYQYVSKTDVGNKYAESSEDFHSLETTYPALPENWFSNSISYSAVENTTYYLAVWCPSVGGATYLANDSVSPDEVSLADWSQTYGEWLNPWTGESDSSDASKYSIYATYTAGGAEEEAPQKQDILWFD